MSNSVASDALNLEMEEPSDKVIYKRRSSIFQSRTSKLLVDEETDKEKNAGNDEFLPISNCKRQRVEDVRKENFDLQSYIADLREERKTWQMTLKERKSDRRVLSKKKSSLEQLGQSLDLEALSDSERSFLSAHPNYEYVYENSQKLSNVALKMTLLNELVYKLNERFMLRMREKLCKATKKIVDMSE
ncbi:hypothetical protein KPH14_006822 [Odynerus spinipes]|uniref:Uncharacterized protein n=1 Tax=Odynerus spinipes TaxID=1348599 RepID=A0AAD9RRA3_9HYME|nr:hypothetical protein KPH14_006822 [Odynerus spinipes]